MPGGDITCPHWHFRQPRNFMHFTTTECCVVVTQLMAVPYCRLCLNCLSHSHFEGNFWSAIQVNLQGLRKTKIALKSLKSSLRSGNSIFMFLEWKTWVWFSSLLLIWSNRNFSTLFLFSISSSQSGISSSNSEFLCTELHWAFTSKLVQYRWHKWANINPGKF